MSRSTAKNSGRTSPVGVLVLLGLWLTIGLMPVLFSITDLRLAFGLTGQAGTAVVERCTEHTSGTDDYVECRGSFQPSDHRAAPTADVHLPPESDEGESFPARLQDDGDRARPADLKGRLAAAAVPALGVFFLVPLPWALLYMITGRGPNRISRYAMASLAIVTAGLCLAGLIAAQL
ncbi:hypothetical protein [Actinomadura sp. 9N407]|uniref:hypothetical protein n=1 Tax=Actinomadura sp. 9N407 TaxID=3375154 RepID=UPI0037ADC1B4